MDNRIALTRAGTEQAFDADSLRKNWDRLHQGDCEPLPKDSALLEAWVLFHNGEFENAIEAGLSLGGHGITVANKAASVCAVYLEPREKAKLDLLLDVAGRAETQQSQDPKNANAWYWQAYALAHYGQGISVAKALAQGLGGKVKNALEQTIRLSPKHADAHLALARFHAEVIDKVGALIGAMTFGAKKSTGLALFKETLKLNPHSPIAMIEYAKGLVVFEGERKMKDATRLYEQAATSRPFDATERLEVELARVELQD